MDIQAFIARAKAAQEFEHADGGVTLRLRTLGAFDLRRIVAASGEDVVAAQLPILQAAVVGWAGLPADALVPGETGPAPFAPELVPLAANALPQLFDGAFAELMKRASERVARVRDEAKN
jgi:hypothetical protein